LGRRHVGNVPHVKTILLIQLDHLGDAVISTVMFPRLRRRYPGASIEVLAGPWNREVFEAMPEVDRVHVCRANRFARNGRLGWMLSTVLWGIRLRRRRVDLGIDVRGEFPHAMILWLCGALRRLGWSSGGGGFLLTDSPQFVADRPEVESRLALLAELGIPAHEKEETARPAFRPSDEARRRVGRWLAEVREGEMEPAGPRIVVHVGAGTPAKRWPVEHWRGLVGGLVGRLGAQVVLVGDASDGAVARAILGPRPWPAVADWTGRLSLAELAALLERADLFVGGDSGPAHLAAAVGTPGVVLFSGTNRARQWQPRGENVRVLRHPVPCSPCHRQSCPWREHPCMRGLMPWQVAAAVEAMYRRAAGASEKADRKEADDDCPA
jgi:lipopolysaccharide heptosyltransferase II